MHELLKNYHQQFADFNSDSNLQQNWLSDLRQAGLSQLDQVGFPTNRDENWRYTNIKPLLKQAFNISVSANAEDITDISQRQLNDLNIEGLESHQIFIVDGQLNQSLSDDIDIKGLKVVSLCDELKNNPERVAQYINQLLPESTHGFMALNCAFIQHGVWIEVDSGIEVKKPVELIFIHSGDDHAMVQPRNIFVAGKNSNFKIIERYVSLNDNKTMTNTISEMFVDESAVLEHVRIQEESQSANHISGSFIKLEEKAHFSTSTITLGGNLTRNDLRCQISGSGSHSNMYGLYAANRKQHIDNFTQVEHQVANCTSDELYKGVLDDRSRAVFHGRIYVAQDAQQTDAYQNNRTLLLSRDAEIDTKPQLEIYADDVKCSHGATIGQLNEEYMFYLRARGVSRSKARRMLTFAFVKEALNAITIGPLKNYLEDRLDAQLLNGKHYGD